MAILMGVGEAELRQNFRRVRNFFYVRNEFCRCNVARDKRPLVEPL